MHFQRPSPWLKEGGGRLVPSRAFPAQGLHAAAFVVCSCSIWCDKRVGAEVHVMSLCGFAALKAWFLWGPHSRRQWQVTLNRTSPTLVNLRHLTDSGGGCSHRGWKAFGASQAGGGASMVPVLPPGMGVLSQAVAVAVWCTPGVPVCKPTVCCVCLCAVTETGDSSGSRLNVWGA